MNNHFPLVRCGVEFEDTFDHLGRTDIIHTRTASKGNVVRGLQYFERLPFFIGGFMLGFLYPLGADRYFFVRVLQLV